MATRKRRRRAGEAGFGTVLALGVMGFLVVLGGAVAPLSLRQLRASAALLYGNQAFYAADAGLAAAVPWMQANYTVPNPSGYFDTTASPVTYSSLDVTLPGNHPNSYTDAEGNNHTDVSASFASELSTQTFGAGSYDVTATLLSAEPEIWELQSTAVVGTHTATVGARIERSGESVFQGGVFGRDKVELSGGAAIDTYDSSAGSYGGANVLLDQANVGSNGEIRLSGSSAIWGDAHPGPGESVNSSSSIGVSGSTTPSAQERVLPPVVVPAEAVPIPDISISGGGTGSISSGVYVLDEITLSGGSTLTVDVSGGPVIFYVGKVTVSGGGFLNTGQDPLAFSIYGTSTQNVTLSGGSAFYGAVYAPDSKVDISSSSALHGAVIGREVKLTGEGGLHYDASLGNGSSGGDFRMVSWWRVQ